MFRRILMNAADPDTTGSGGGAVVPPTAAPAQPATPAPAPLTVDAMLSAMDDPATRDRFFAEMRRSGRIKGATKPTGTETPAPETTAPAMKAPETEMVSRADLARDRAFNRSIAIHGQGLTERQIARMEAAFEAQKPNAAEAGTWVAEYIADLGLKSTVAATTVTPPVQPQSPAPAVAPSTPPTSTTSVPGAPPPLADPSARRLIDMTDAERRDYQSRYGIAKYVEKQRAEARDVRVVMKR